MLSIKAISFYTLINASIGTVLSIKLIIQCFFDLLLLVFTALLLLVFDVLLLLVFNVAKTDKHINIKLIDISFLGIISYSLGNILLLTDEFSASAKMDSFRGGLV